ncbi:hypothetical protein EXIGLDRAFT_778687 [Exidia glandulosa HHB12029]|uniref:Uncharacterized protein n=1 Tax=Exidia glandulosa HHB12029 TaxID=1314781 RepID=A0A165CFD3_EXIGL|nr:hypothetical protein EXIGLDRAFT_778685 [Exidia glandulosa HHB12029]KZV82370.1 hypothetical protein EXIGLDRAFT_778687 [Exidia glandulosa HHB12029]
MAYNMPSVNESASAPLQQNFQPGMHRVAFPAPSAHRERPMLDAAPQNAASAALAHLNYATYMYYIGVAALAQARLAQSAAAYPQPAPSPAVADPARGHGHLRVHSTASNTSLRSSLSSASSLDTPASALFTPAGAAGGAMTWNNSGRDAVRTPDTCCSDIVSDDDGTGCPLNDLPTSCANTPVEALALSCGGVRPADERAKIASLAAAATLRTNGRTRAQSTLSQSMLPCASPPLCSPSPVATRSSPAQLINAATWSDDGLPLASQYALSGYNRMSSPFADKAWWECVTNEKPWAPLPPAAKMDLRRLPKINTRVQHYRSRRRTQSTANKVTSWPAVLPTI